MEAAQAREVAMASKDEEVGYAIKGKRTKRQRLQSPLPFVISPTRSEEAFLEDHRRGGSNVFSSYSSLDQFQTSTDEDEEEEDMANCLILLAQGVQFHKSAAPVSKSPDNHKYSPSPVTFPVSCTAAGKIGRSYDYECKTCGRTFPSFQALGGHRASHKKPRAISAVEAAKREIRLSVEEDDEEEEEEEEAKIKNRYSYPLSLSLNPRIQSGNNKPNKIHECSICGAEFSSGQALGGHMRRHRAPLMATTTALSLNPLMAGVKREEQQNKRKRSGISLDLDLNLPALPEDYQERRESRLTSLIDHSKQQKKQQQKQESPRVFTSPALVDCHY